jgi:SecD/SecF fusion protein
MKKRIFGHISLIVLTALILGFYNLPSSLKSELKSNDKQEMKEVEAGFIENFISFFTDQDIKLGLDLQGGAKLQYKVDLSKTDSDRHEQVIQGNIKIVEDRVNKLGVSEPNIYTEDIGEDRIISVELAGVKDLDEAKAQIGKTVQLEFKEQKSVSDEDKAIHLAKVQTKIDGILAQTKENPEKFAQLSKEAQTTDPENISYELSPTPLDAETIFSVLKLNPEQIESIKSGAALNKEVFKLETETVKGLVKFQTYEENEEEIETEREISYSNILISYKGAEQAAETVTRSKEEAKKLAEELLVKAKSNPEKFAEFAKESSDAKSREQGGKIEETLKKSSTNFEENFKEEVLKLKKGEISEVIETKFGFLIAKVDEVIKEGGLEKVSGSVATYETLVFNIQPSTWADTGLTGEQFVLAQTEINTGNNQPVVQIRFNAEGGKLFGEITERNIGKPIAIFVGGEMISAPIVNGKIPDGVATITLGQGALLKEAQELTQNLNTGAVKAPLILIGEYSIGSTLGNEALDTSLKAGLIGFIILAIYMIAYYRLLGFLAVISLSIYASVLLFVIKSAIPLPIAYLISLGLFTWIFTKIINSKDGGFEKFISGSMSLVGIFFIANVLATPIVLTLAGVAGVILSIGMAVDANILIFERIKEELEDGKPLISAIENGFSRAWDSIRDSNFSSLITCAILFYIGTSIISGFALNLAIGILISMFTAISITKTFIKGISVSKLAQKSSLLLPIRKNKNKTPWKIIQNSKYFFVLSFAAVLISAYGFGQYGLKAGIDFTGGSIMELKFEKETNAEEISKTLSEIEAEINTNLAENKEAVEIKNAIVIASNKNFLIKTKHLSNEKYEIIKEKLSSKISPFEAISFNSVGPSIGETLKDRAIIAIFLALLGIVIFTALAFRQIPKKYSAWRFGVSAIVALAHDIIIVSGVFAFLGYFYGVEVDLLFITALLTILGFSVHDTIVVLDRLRENIRMRAANESFADLTNRALTQTMARSINTSISTLITLLALYFLGITSIQWFLLALIIGIIVGTYSSIFIAPTFLVKWHQLSEKSSKN